MTFWLWLEKSITEIAWRSPKRPLIRSFMRRRVEIKRLSLFFSSSHRVVRRKSENSTRRVEHADKEKTVKFIKTLAIICIIVLSVMSFALVAAVLFDKHQNKGSSPFYRAVFINVYGARERIGNNGNLDNFSGHIDFSVMDRWGFYRVVFVDRRFDGILDEVRLCKKQGGGEIVLFNPLGIIKPLADNTAYTSHEWNQRFLEIRKEAAGPTSLPSR